MVSKLTLEYDGSGFAGWVRQPGLRTVEAELQRALHTILGSMGSDGRPLTLRVAGRTDAGVHAWGQVVSYAHEAVDPARLNGLLGDDVAVLSTEPAAHGFDARRDARSRTYCYRVLARRARSALERGRALWWAGELDRAALRECARALNGRHDFRAFTPAETQHTRFEREILRAEWRVLPAAGGGWATEIVAGNAGTSSLTVRVDLFKDDGTPFTTTLDGRRASSFTNLTIPAGGVLTLAPRDRNGDDDF